MHVVITDIGGPDARRTASIANVSVSSDVSARAVGCESLSDTVSTVSSSSLSDRQPATTTTSAFQFTAAGYDFHTYTDMVINNNGFICIAAHNIT